MRLALLLLYLLVLFGVSALLPHVMHALFGMDLFVPSAILAVAWGIGSARLLVWWLVRAAKLRAGRP